MVPQKKVFAVDNLAAKFKDAKGVAFADYQGLNFTQLSNLRRDIKKTGAEFEIVKNTLLIKAARDSKFPLDEAKLTGPTAMLWIYDDNPGILKILYQFIKENELPKIKFGFWHQEELTAEKLGDLAKLPSLDELRANVVGSLKSPIYGLVNSLNWNTQKLVLTLKAISLKTQ